MTRSAVVLIVAAALGTARCGEDAATPTEPTTSSASTAITGHFVGALSIGGSRFYSFTVAQSGTVSATLASITTPRTGSALDVALGLGFGRPAGTGCSLSHAVTTGGSLTAQLHESASAGIYCISVYDAGELTGDVDFAVRFSHP
jgi:hypothetical protein